MPDISRAPGGSSTASANAAVAENGQVEEAPEWRSLDEESPEWRSLDEGSTAGLRDQPPWMQGWRGAEEMLDGLC